MSAKPTIAAVVLAALSVAAALLVWRDGEAEAAADAILTPLFSPEEIPLESIDRITLARRGEPAMVFARDELGAWEQIEPFRYPVQAFSMRQFPVLASQLQTAGTVEAEDLASLGLEPPLATLTMAWEGGTRRLRFGRSGLGGRTYALVDRETTPRIVTGELPARVIGGAEKEWRDRTLFRDVGADAVRVIVDRGATRAVIERDRSRWRVAEPVRTRASRSQVEYYLDVLAAAEHGGFVVDRPEDLGRFGLDEPVGRIVVERDGRRAATTTLLIGSTVDLNTEARHAMLEGVPVVFSIPGETLTQLFPDAGLFLDPTASGINAADVKRIEIRGPESTFSLLREASVEGTTWRVPEREDAVVPTERVDEFLRQLTEAAAGAVHVGAYPREAEVATVIFHGYDGLPLDTVRLAREAANGRWLADNGDGVQRLFPASTEMPLTPEAWGINR